MKIKKCISNEKFIIGGIIAVIALTIIFFYLNNRVISENFLPRKNTYDAKTASESKVPTMILFYDSKPKTKVDKRMNNRYINNYRKAGRKSSAPFYIVDTNSILSIGTWKTRLPANPPLIRYYTNPSLGEGKDGMENVHGYNFRFLLDFLKSKGIH